MVHAEHSRQRATYRDRVPEQTEELWRRRASSFGSSAVEYADHRPDYAPEAIAWALSAANHAHDVVDVGAGTGALTGGLVSRGCRIVALEPDERMLAELHRRIPEALAVNAAAEALPLRDGSVDAVLAATSFHWFDRDRALAEFVRVLRPGGVLALLYNRDDESVPWVAEIGRLSRTSASSDRSDDDDDWFQHPRFDPPEVARFPHGQPRTAESMTSTVGTNSHTQVVSSEERAATLARVRNFLDTCPDTAHGTFTRPLITTVARVQRR